MKAINSEDFDKEVLQETQPVLVDFWAEWCGPCKMISPILEELSGNYEGKLKIVKSNIDENTDLAMRYAIRSIPTLLLFKNGEVKGQLLGAVPKSKIIDFINSHI